MTPYDRAGLKFIAICIGIGVFVSAFLFLGTGTTSLPQKSSETENSENAASDENLSEYASSDIVNDPDNEERSPNVQALISGWQAFYVNCDHADYTPQRYKACAGVRQFERKLEAIGWCYGENAASHADMAWAKCQSGPKRLSVQQQENEDLRSLWSENDSACEGAKDEGYQRLACQRKEDVSRQLSDRGYCFAPPDHINTFIGEWKPC